MKKRDYKGPYQRLEERANTNVGTSPTTPWALLPRLSKDTLELAALGSRREARTFARLLRDALRTLPSATGVHSARHQSGWFVSSSSHRLFRCRRRWAYVILRRRVGDAILRGLLRANIGLSSACPHPCGHRLQQPRRTMDCPRQQLSTFLRQRLPANSPWVVQRRKGLAHLAP